MLGVLLVPVSRFQVPGERRECCSSWWCFSFTLSCIYLLRHFYLLPSPLPFICSCLSHATPLFTPLLPSACFSHSLLLLTRSCLLCLPFLTLFTRPTLTHTPHPRSPILTHAHSSILSPHLTSSFIHLDTGTTSCSSGFWSFVYLVPVHKL